MNSLASSTCDESQPLLGLSDDAVSSASSDVRLRRSCTVVAVPAEAVPPPSATKRGPYDVRSWRPIIAVWVTLFCAECSRGLVLPSLFLYVRYLGGGAKELGYIIGVFSVGRLGASFALGWWQSWRGAKEALLISLAVSFVGNALYLASDSPIKSVWLVLGARLLVGFGSGVLGVVRAVVAECTAAEQRVRFVAWTNLIQYVAFAVVPGECVRRVFFPGSPEAEECASRKQWAKTQFDTWLEQQSAPGSRTNLIQYVAFAVVPVIGGAFGEVKFSVSVFAVQYYTAPALVLCALNAAAVVLVCVAVRGSLPSVGDGSSVAAPVGSQRRVYIAGVVLFIALNFVARGVVAYFETLGPAMFAELWPDHDHTKDVEYDAEMLSIIGAAGLVFYFVVDPLSKRFGEDRMLVASLGLLGLGSAALVSFRVIVGVPFTLYQFLAGAVLLWGVATPMVQTLIISSFSKILGSKPQAKMMAWITAAGSVGRILCPASAGWLGPSGSFLVAAVFCGLCIVAVVVYEKVRSASQRKLAAALPAQQEQSL